MIFFKEAKKEKKKLITKIKSSYRVVSKKIVNAFRRKIVVNKSIYEETPSLAKKFAHRFPSLGM
jgi:hypothetical protein